MKERKRCVIGYLSRQNVFRLFLLSESEMEKFSEWFWTDSFWLPPNVTWKDFEKHKDTRLPEASEALLSIPLAFVLLFLRFGFER